MILTMKKFLKFVAAIASATVLVLGVLYVIKNFFLKEDSFDDFTDFDDFDDDFDMDFTDDEHDYVTLRTDDEDSIDVPLEDDIVEDDAVEDEDAKVSEDESNDEE